MAIKQLKLVGKNSGDIFLLRYPNSLLDFCGFDFTSFAKSAVDLCNEALKAGSPDYDRISSLRRDIQSAHCYIENNIRTCYDKIVFDCWIDYVCRRDNITESDLWKRLVHCKTPFDKAIFARLCEFRFNRASNEWLSIIRVQDYAKSKLDFIFAKTLASAEEAAARRNYFDMMFSVTAREMGCRLEDLGITKIFSIGRVPPAPFMFPNISKEIVRHVLANFDYSDDYSDIGDYSESSDQIAMDAFSKMKNGLPKDLAGYNISGGIPERNNGKIYMPCSLKAAIDLEIDAIIEDGAWLARCKRCQRFFLRSAEHPEEYCSRSMPGERTCLQIYEDEHPRPTMTPELEERCRRVTDEVYSRVDKTMSVKEYDSWHLYLEAMISKVKNGEIAPSELESFLDYSLEVDISKSKPIVEVPKPEPEPMSHERVVKPFVPERISRSDIPAPPPEPVFEELSSSQAPKDGFFISPTVQRQKNERPQISHIIRNGESLGDNAYKRPDPAGFREFGAPPVQPPQDPSNSIRAVELPQFFDPAAKNQARNPAVRPDQTIKNNEPANTSAYRKLNLLEERLGEENRIRREQQAERQRNASGGKAPAPGFRPFGDFQVPQSGQPVQKDPENSGNKQSSAYDTPKNGREEPAIRRGSVYDDHRSEPVERRGKSIYDYADDDREESAARRGKSIYDYTDDDREEPAARRGKSIYDYADDDREEPVARRGKSIYDYADDDREEPVARRGKSIYDYADDDREESAARRGKSIYDYADDDREESAARRGKPGYDNAGDDRDEPVTRRAYDDREEGSPSFEQPGKTAPKVIRKNAAAISAYGKAAGTPFAAAGSMDKKMPESEPFKDIGSLFDYLEQSDNNGSSGRNYGNDRRSSDREYARDRDNDYSYGEPGERVYNPRDLASHQAYDKTEPYSGRESGYSRDPEPEPAGERKYPDRVTADNAPSGFWTEERNLFPQNGQPESGSNSADDLDDGSAAPPAQKRHKTNKTKRLLDAIMSEPDDNPNFRKK